MSDIRFNRWLHQSGTGGVYQDSSGNVGVGTSVPRASIDIAVGSASSIRIGTAITISHSNGIQVGSSSLHSTGLNVQSINSTGIITATTFSGNLNSTGVTTVTTLNIGTGASISSPASNVLTLGTNNVERVRIDSSGNLGIGTNNPRFRLEVGAVGASGTSLHVNGDARVTGILSVGQGTITINGNTDKITAPKLDYAGISSTITATAVDVFVYDTRKDSDGGAWRKRTQHTSWYNETLNTATRGSRRDFPAVAVIVCAATSVTIYDGDDPDMPMWMVFNTVNGMIYTSANNLTSVSMLNGTLVWTGFRSGIINFISESAELLEAGYAYILRYGIINRNVSATWNATTGRQIVNNTCNDVAMTVLPNAPIDSATGLPVPTIAVATQGGISIITDSGTVYNLTPESNAAYTSIKNFYSVGFDSNQKLFFTDSQTTSGFSQLIYLPNYNYNQSLSDQYSSLSGSYNYVWNAFINDTATQVGYWAPSNSARLIKPSVATRDSIAIGYTGSGLGGEGLSLIGQQNNYLMNCGITTTFNTGWLYGYTQGAFLSDTSTTSVTGTELVTNGTFTTNTSGWVANGSGSHTFSVVSGTLQIVRGTPGLGGGEPYQNITLTAGKTYILSWQVTSGDMTTALYDGTIGGTALVAVNSGGAGYFFRQFTVTTTGTKQLLFISNNANSTSAVDNVSIREAELDRSINNKGLAVYGTITKTAVATGADLVAYGGFSISNYLLQPYNSAIAFGTADFSYMGWAKATTAGGYLFQWDNPNSASGIRISMFNSTTVRVTVTSVVDRDITYSALTGTWNFFVVQRVGSIIYTYINGVQIDSFSNTTNLSGTDKVLTFGYNGNSTLNLALWRVSASVPSPDQIKKIYNDEKMLFQENSKATLYGTSSAVTALAYDDSTRLLYAGTSSGRSDFQGLERINNTTTAVTTAISASNGLIAEQ